MWVIVSISFKIEFITCLSIFKIYIDWSNNSITLFIIIWSTSNYKKINIIGLYKELIDNTLDYGWNYDKDNIKWWSIINSDYLKKFSKFIRTKTYILN